MAHFARLDENNVVTDVIVVDDQWLLGPDGNENETIGIAALQAWSGHPYWAQTSYNNRIRFRYAGIGFTFDPVLNAFIRPRPFPSWNLNQQTTDWEAPTPPPEDAMSESNPSGKIYFWDEPSLSWIEQTNAP